MPWSSRLLATLCLLLQTLIHARPHKRSLADGDTFPSRPSPEILYFANTTSDNLDYTTSQNALNLLHCQDDKDSGALDVHSYRDFVISYRAVKPRDAPDTATCHIDPEIIQTDYHTFDKAPFLTYLRRSLPRPPSPNTATTMKKPVAGIVCGIQNLRGHFKCPPLTSRDWTRGAHLNTRALSEDQPLPWPAIFEQASYRKYYEVIVTVKGRDVDIFTDTEILAQRIQAATKERLASKYGFGWPCSYRVNVQVNPSSSAPSSRDIHYKTTFKDTSLWPDGYEFPGSFYTDPAGNPRFYGPTIDVFEGDRITFEMTNEGHMEQATHFHGMLMKDYQFSDGTAGLAQGTLTTGKTYNQTLVASPAGTTLIHGHYMQAFAMGNRAPLIVRKRPCTDPYAGWYDEEMVLTLDSAMPWYLDEKKKTRALRHASGMEDWTNLQNPAEANYYYFPPPRLSYGGQPHTLQPWGGALINGQSRGIPLNYSSDLGSNSSQSWGEPRGKYFMARVKRGKTYRLRLVNTAIEWGFRFWIEGHDMTIISISGGDIKPIHIPATQSPPVENNAAALSSSSAYQPHSGIELQVTERYDVLVTMDQPGPAAIVHVDSIDGCYKGVGFLLYDDVDGADGNELFVRSQLQVLGDALQRNRRCDEDCYTNPHVGCDMYKQFSADRNLSQIVSIEPQGIPPLNTQGTRREMVFTMTMMATAPGEAEREVFLMNGQLTPVFQPPLYEQHARMHRTKGADFSSFQNASYLEYYSFAPNEVVDWCLVSQFPGRHPIHLHADRMWVLATGAGGVEDCWKDQSHVEGKPTLWTDVITTPTYSTPFEHAGGGGGGEKGGWVKMRMRISNVGVWFMHCHRDLHMNERLLVPIMIGVNSTWPVPPLDWPQGGYDDY